MHRASRAQPEDKGKTKGLGEITLEVQADGDTLVKLSSTSSFGSKTLKRAVAHQEMVNGVPILKGYPPPALSRPAGFLGGEQNLTAAWEGDDYAVYYVRETPSGDVVWVAEHRLTYAPPSFVHVFFGKKTGDKITGEWIDVPKGKTSGTLSLLLKDPQSLQSTAKTGGFLAGELWRSLPNSLRGFADLHTHPTVVPMECSHRIMCRPMPKPAS